MNTPLVTVIMSVYNGATYLRDALESILAQTFTDFEFIVVDDASTDATPEILRGYVSKDKRINILTNKHNMERSLSRNKAINLARAELIAVMDADDVSLPRRLEKQVAFMSANPDVVACGTARSVYGKPDEVWTPPLDDAGNRCRLLFDTCMCHPTVMYRKSSVVAAKGYDPAMPPAEDYDLWVRLARISGVRFANLPEILLRYRADQGDRGAYKSRQQNLANEVRKKLLLDIGIEPTERELESHFALCNRDYGLSINKIFNIRNWMKKLFLHATNDKMKYDSIALKHELHNRWKTICANSNSFLFGISVYFLSDFSSISVDDIKKFCKKMKNKLFYK
jgi:glycosyltransferase involved in cell wall biosynthesis